MVILGSGNVVHNLRGMDWGRPDQGFDWAQRFGEDAKTTMLDDPTEIPRLDAHPEFPLAVPTPDHFAPLLYMAGVAGASSEDVDVLIDGYAYGSLSMTAYTIGLDRDEVSGGEGGQAAVATPAQAPPDATNI